MQPVPTTWAMGIAIFHQRYARGIGHHIDRAGDDHRGLKPGSETTRHLVQIRRHRRAIHALGTHIFARHACDFGGVALDHVNACLVQKFPHLGIA